MANDHDIVIAGGNTAAEFFAVLRFKILLCGSKDIGGRVKLVNGRCPLFHKMIRDCNHALIAKTQVLAFHGRCDHGPGLTGANYVGKLGIAAKEDPGNCLFLMVLQLDERIDAMENNHVCIVFRRYHRIELLIVELGKPFGTVRILPEPFLELFLDILLLVPGGDGLIRIQNAPFFAVRAFHRIEYLCILLVQGVFYQTVGRNTGGAVGGINDGPVQIPSLIGDLPGVHQRLINGPNSLFIILKVPILIKVQKLVDEVRDVILGDPGGAQTNGDVLRLQRLRDGI